MKKPSQFLALTAVMAVTCALSTPAFAANADRDPEGTPSIFHSIATDTYYLPTSQVVTPTAQDTTGWNWTVPVLMDDNDHYVQTSETVTTTTQTTQSGSGWSWTVPEETNDKK